MAKPDAAAIDALLPQTQCQACGYAGCKPYAEAIAQGATIRDCAPGGLATWQALATLLDEPTTQADQDYVAKNTQAPSVVWIDKNVCIGCTKCIKACPVDAIVGAAKHLHDVIESECTGCQLCIEPCPVDCIHIKPIETRTQPHTNARAEVHRARHEAHQARNKAQQRANRHRHLHAKKGKIHLKETITRSEVVQQALARAKAKYQGDKP